MQPFECIDRGRPVLLAHRVGREAGLPVEQCELVEGGTVDGIGHALYAGMTFEGGRPAQTNFDRYRILRHSEAPRDIEVHFVDEGVDPTGLGEPPFPPIVGALANALSRARGERVYDQPFVGELEGALG